MRLASYPRAHTFGKKFVLRGVREGVDFFAKEDFHKWEKKNKGN